MLIHVYAHVSIRLFAWRLFILLSIINPSYAVRLPFRILVFIHCLDGSIRVVHIESGVYSELVVYRAHISFAFLFLFSLSLTTCYAIEYVQSTGLEHP